MQDRKHLSNLEIGREYNSQLTITNNTKLLKYTLLYSFRIVQNNLPCRILILSRHINIQQFFYSSTFIFYFEQSGQNLNSCLWQQKTKILQLDIILILSYMFYISIIMPSQTYGKQVRVKMTFINRFFKTKPRDDWADQFITLETIQ